MEFSLIDQIIELEVGERITAIKSLSLAEEYLQDHFPRFPVMPGVLMLESMVQASAWLIRQSDDFDRPIVLLKEARNVKYADFVAPGQQLRVESQIVKQEESSVTVKARGTVNDSVAVSGRLILDRFAVSERAPAQGPINAYTVRKLRQQFANLYPAASQLDFRTSGP